MITRAHEEHSTYRPKKIAKTRNFSVEKYIRSLFNTNND